MLQNMRHTSTVWRIGLETDGKYIIVVISGDMKILRASIFMFQIKGCKLKFRNMFFSLQ